MANATILVSSNYQQLWVQSASCAESIHSFRPRSKAMTSKLPAGIGKIVDGNRNGQNRNNQTLASAVNKLPWVDGNTPINSYHVRGRRQAPEVGFLHTPRPTGGERVTLRRGNLPTGQPNPV